MWHENVDAVRRGMEAWGAGDWEAWVAEIDPEMTWEETPGLGPDPAIYRGVDEVTAAVSSWLDVWVDYDLTFGRTSMRVTKSWCWPTNAGGKPLGSRSRLTSEVVQQFQRRLHTASEKLIGQLAVGERPGELQGAEHVSEQRERVRARSFGMRRV